MKHTVAFVGGGPAAVSALAQLLSTLINAKKNNIAIYVIEKGSTIGPGLPYSTRETDHILNIDSDVMSPIPNHPSNFYHWLNSNWQSFQFNTKLDKIEPTKNKFPPRFLFGVYLNCLSYNIKEYAKKHGIDIIYVTNTEVIDIDEHKQNYIISLSNSTKVIADQVVLCTGHMPSSTYRELIGCKNYFHSVWPSSAYVNRFPHNETIVVIGSNLSAIDAVLALVAHGHTGKILMVSPSGQLPAVLGKITPYTRKILTLETLSKLTLRGSKTITLKTLLSLFLQELSLAEDREVTLESILQRNLSPKEYIEKQIHEAKQGPRAWQCFLFSLYSIVPDLWNSLDEMSKLLFLKSFHGPFIKNLAAFPIENAEKILKLLESNQLEVYSDLQSVKFDGVSEEFSIEYGNNKLYTKYVINGTGPGHDIEHMDIPLYNNLLKKDLVSANPLGGINVNFNSFRVLNSNNEESRGLFAVGEITKGVYLATTDLSQVGQQLKQVIFQINYNISNRDLSNLVNRKLSVFKSNYQSTVNEDYTQGISQHLGNYSYGDERHPNLCSKL